jgi:hypothetical protein
MDEAMDDMVYVTVDGAEYSVARGQAVLDLGDDRLAILMWGESFPATYIGHRVEKRSSQMTSAQNISDAVFKSACVCAFAFPTATIEHVAERVASYYGYDDPPARSVFVGAIVSHLERNMD